MRRFLLVAVLLALAPLEAHAKAIRAFVGRYGYRDPGIVFLAPSVEYGGIRAETHRDSSGEQVVAHGPQYAVSLLGVSAGDRDLQGEASLGYRHMNLEGLEIEQRPDIAFVEGHIGLRYFPRAPTLLFAEQFAVRVTAAAGGGVAVSTTGDLNTPIDLSAGLHFGVGREPHGLMVEVVHRPNHFDMKYRPDNDPGDPVVPEAKYDISGWTAIRVSVFFGP